MIATRLKLNSFRNFSSQEIVFKSGVNIIYGTNASGKTNLIEALYFVSNLTGFRTERDIELVRKGNQGFQVECDLLYDSGGNLAVDLVFKNGKKYLRANNVPVLKLSEWFGRVPIYLFSPDSLHILWGEPTRRRGLWDAEIIKSDKESRSSLLNYQLALRNRNKILRELSTGYGSSEHKSLLDFYTESLVVYGSKIISARLRHLSEVMKLIGDLYHMLTKERLILRIRYSTSIKSIRSESDFHYIRNKYDKALEAARKSEIEKGYTLYGPHRDDIKFYLNDVPVTQIASQGQVRAVAIALLLSLAEVHTKKTGEHPIILLDDALSELDDERKKNLIQLIMKYPQCLLTSASKKEVQGLLSLSPTIFKVERGTLVRTTFSKASKVTTKA